MGRAWGNGSADQSKSFHYAAKERMSSELLDLRRTYGLLECSAVEGVAGIFARAELSDSAIEYSGAQHGEVCNLGQPKNTQRPAKESMSAELPGLSLMSGTPYVSPKWKTSAGIRFGRNLQMRK